MNASAVGLEPSARDPVRAQSEPSRALPVLSSKARTGSQFRKLFPWLRFDWKVQQTIKPALVGTVEDEFLESIVAAGACERFGNALSQSAGNDPLGGDLAWIHRPQPALKLARTFSRKLMA